MKVRIENQEVRLRLSEEELIKFKAGNILSTHLIYGEGILNSQSYTLLLTNRVDKISLDSTNGIFEILFPENYLNQWDDKKIGFEAWIEIPGYSKLKVIVERDLKKRKTQ